MRVLMVCLGNICRSPTAEAVLRAHARARGVDLHVESAGTAGWHEGKGADPRTIAHARRRGLDLSAHRARRVRDDDFVSFDRLYAMDGSNLQTLLIHAPDAHRHKIQLLLGDEDVPDPWAGGPEDFERVLDLCTLAAQRILDALERP